MGVDIYQALKRCRLCYRRYSSFIDHMPIGGLLVVNFIFCKHGILVYHDCKAFFHNIFLQVWNLVFTNAVYSWANHFKRSQLVKVSLFLHTGATGWGSPIMSGDEGNDKKGPAIELAKRGRTTSKRIMAMAISNFLKAIDKGKPNSSINNLFLKIEKRLGSWFECG